MSGGNYSVTCPGCKGENALRGKAMTLALTCQSCHTYFRIGNWSNERVEFLHKESQKIALGSKGRINNILYEVIGFVVKQEDKYHYRWREYLLFNPYNGYAFLSEYNGHWNFIWPIENEPPKQPSAVNFFYENQEYKLYQKDSAQVVYANGEFFFDVVGITASTRNYEYISPPYILALEQSDDSTLWCKGEYFSTEAVSKIFSIPKSKLPVQTGIGYTQPFKTTFREQSLILMSIVFVALALFIQIVFSSGAEDKVVFQRDYNEVDLKDQKVLVTESFDLTGTKNIEFYIYAPISNDWFFSEFSLINESNGNEYNFSKEIEYYSGYEGGESWTEGSNSGEAFLSQIPAGRYHLNIYPEFSFNNHSFSISIKRDVKSLSNFFITCFIILLYPTFYFIRKYYREKKRWSESDYSPYETE